MTGEELMKTASQLAFSQAETLEIKTLLSDENANSDLANSVFKTIAERSKATQCKLMCDSMDLSACVDEFSKLDFDTQKSLISEILLAFRGNRQSKDVNLKQIGGKKTAGKLRPARAKLPEKFFIINQSVTGMFERKTYVGL